MEENTLRGCAHRGIRVSSGYYYQSTQVLIMLMQPAQTAFQTRSKMSLFKTMDTTAQCIRIPSMTWTTLLDTFTYVPLVITFGICSPPQRSALRPSPRVRQL